LEQPVVPTEADLRGARARAQGGSPLAPETKEEAEARRQRYSLDKYAKPSAEQMMAHE